jgi:hypothetical protein
MDKKHLIEILLEKRFKEKDPAKIFSLSEINVFSSNDSEENPIGIGVQLIIEDQSGSIIKEEYQVREEGIIFSWGNTPVIDEKSLFKKINE